MNFVKWSNSQDFDHDHCQKTKFKFLVVKMVNLNLKFDCGCELVAMVNFLTIDHGANSRAS